MPAERIVSHLPSTTEIACALGLEAQEEVYDGVEEGRQGLEGHPQALGDAARI